jgi:8-oxo-dGTP pyrophosphatase MutT (NUDIX family)
MSMPRNDPEVWTVLSSSYLSRKPWLTLRQDRVRLPNGAIVEDYNVLEYPDWVNIVAITPDQQIVLVRQYRHGIRAVHFELPAGVCAASDDGPEETARRELLEETGYGGGDWSPLMTLSANPGTHSNQTFTYLANGVVPVQEQRLEETEELQVHLVSVEDIRHILATGGIMQALHAAPLVRYLLLIRRE